MHKIVFRLLFVLPILMGECKDPLPAGIETSISGVVIDETVDSAIVGQQFKILEQRNNLPSRYIDSTITDVDGY
ncbi:MAG: hypothetical protein AAF688_06555 [Bacteroidota bacterium]